MIKIIKLEFDRRIREEGLSRIIKCIHLLGEEKLWYKHNENTNSIGNIVLHLCGNVTQYIMSGIDNQKDHRDRSLEFKLSSRITSNELIERIENVVSKANAIVQKLDSSEMTELRKVQGFNESVLSIIIHVIEHFSYHVGQITYFTKFDLDTDTAYYEGLNLDITS